MPKLPPPPVRTISELQCNAAGGWWRAFCNGQDCHHHQAVALAPFTIKWEPNASSDMIRNNLICEKCGHKGVTLSHPSWGDCIVGWQSFPKPRAFFRTALAINHAGLPSP